MIKNVTQKFIDFNLKISGKIFPEKFNNLLKLNRKCPQAGNSSVSRKRSQKSGNTPLKRRA